MQNVSSLYNPSSSKLHPEFLVYHKDDQTSILMTQIITDELLFNQANPERKLLARMLISFKLYNSYENPALLDSSSTKYLINKEGAQKQITLYQTIKTPEKTKYLLEVEVADLQREKSTKAFISIDKRNFNSRQNFTVISPEKRFMYFENYFKPGQTYQVKHQTHAPKQLFVNYYTPSFPLPLPPFVTQRQSSTRITPDSTRIYRYADSLNFRQKRNSIYHFRVDTSMNDGLTLYNFTQHYPLLRTSEQLIQPLRYLTKSSEYKSLINASNKKLALDNFWLAAAGNIGRAKELIRIYYNRVLFSNLYFTSHTEGWRSDRGMIYIIYGPPSYVYKYDNKEQWIYSSGRDFKSIDFIFYRRENPFTDNNYVLERNNSYKTSWYRAVETWRQGRVFFVTN